MKVLDAEFLSRRRKRPPASAGPRRVRPRWRSPAAPTSASRRSCRRSCSGKRPGAHVRHARAHAARQLLPRGGGARGRPRAERSARAALRRSARLRLRQGVEGASARSGCPSSTSTCRSAPSLKALVMLVDARGASPARSSRPSTRPRSSNTSEARGVSVLAVMTKADKLPKHERKPARGTSSARARAAGASAVSATDGDGRRRAVAPLVVAMELPAIG